MKKQIIKSFTIKDKTYRVSCEILVGDIDKCNLKIIKKYRDEHYLIDPNFAGMCQDIQTDNGWYNLMIWLLRFDKSVVYDYGVLVHEVSHLVDYVFDSLGIDGTCANTEVRSLYIEFWTREILDVLLKK